MKRIRHDPSALVARLASARRLLIVCYGNIIRSPFTAGLLSEALGTKASLSIASAGLGAMPGRAAHPRAVLTASSYGINLGGHVAAALTPDAVASADVIFLMDVAQLAVMRRRFPEARSKTFLLTSLAPEAPREIADPFNQDESMYCACFDHISSAVRPILRILPATAVRP